MEKRILYDPHSPASACQSRVKHLHWTAIVDFQNKEIRASATWSIAINDSDQIAFDTRGLLVERVFTDDQENPFVSWGEENALLGRMLSIRITPDTHIVTIVYKTGPDAAALQWLNPEQTAGKKSSFLFTQSQAILARTWIPCQDSPGIRFTYSADISVPSSLMPLMSASNPVAINPSGFYHFEMDQPIPSYLMALAVGDLLFHPISKRSGIYAEPVSIQKAIWEFADLEKMITAAEELYGSYRWERYDLLVLPPSFPFGGMENPRLTFVTPTIISGDRSLISLVAHELAHSWSGNLVTNATWNDFWLNEGFTVYFETRIMEKLYGAEYAEMLMSLNLHDLLEEIESLNAGGNAADTKLKLKLEGRDPDDGVTEIAYNKGFFFLKAIEERTGRERFDIFIGDYFRDNAFKAMDTDTFIVYLQNYFKSKYDLPIGTEFLNSWIFTEGLPSPQPKVFSTRFSKVDVVADEWSQREGVGADTRSWSTHEWLHFLKRMPSSISISMMEKLDAFGGFTSTGNAEIMAEWGRLVIRHGYEKAYPAVEDFLIRTGRRKFLMPLYNEMAQTISGKQWAARVYMKARPNYHFVATSSIDKRLDFTG